MVHESSGQIFNYYSKEEAAFAKMAMKITNFCFEKNQSKLVDFIEPNKQKVLQDLCNRYSTLECIYYGGYDNAERKKALIVPVDWGYSKADFKIQALKLTVTEYKHSLKHNDFLGAILGQGIKREKVGDIKLTENECFVIIDSVIAEYIVDQMYQVGNYKVDVEKIDDEQLPDIQDEFKSIECTVSSMRLDSIVKAATNMSRSKAAELINKGTVKLNWGVNENTAASVNANDIISIRGKGRFKILKVSPANKKGRTPIQIGKYI
ncbi:RNA-binding protein [Desulfuribacillus alkaliarsenatis]|uniref:RNA-binding S4 domain-containing protein n=1 Tax=Desulfuribacillus alkaliarsenatis TaxID=766136 RepID=A0A1E5FZR6_9FIRM|nr:YlmH/Sll1252 family protein [Desulfuribacillus alkaliarsenatis]OEF96062.1 hypothetical protein BHF68_09995 [Desulfuribacillus alkaliarsenatis]